MLPSLKSESIALIIPDFDYGGEEHRVVFFANSYLAHFKKVYVIAPYGLSSEKLLPDVIQVRINIRKPWHIIKVLRFLKKNRIHCLQGHKRATLPYLYLAETILHENVLFNFDNIYLNYNCLFSFISPRNIAYLSDILKDFYEKYYPSPKYNNIIINMGGVFCRIQSADIATQTKKQLGIENTFVILSLGRLDKQKNQKLLLNALSKSVNKDFVCLMVGDGGLKEELILLSKSLGIYEKVKFLGHRTDIENILNASDLLVQSSIFEGFPNVFIEAASVGLPIVATNVGASRTLIRENGILVKSQNVDELVEALKLVMCNYSQYKYHACKLAQSSFLLRFKRETMLENYINFYLRLMQQGDGDTKNMLI
jgi:glycosyltransferase involved in cell wall biosynthesis